jgi:hypothetical protein
MNMQEYEQHKDFIPTAEQHLRVLLHDALDANKRLKQTIRAMTKTIKHMPAQRQATKGKGKIHLPDIGI